MSTNNDLVYLTQEMERIKKAMADKTVSLNEAQRLQEKREVESRLNARKKELRERPEPGHKVFELTLKQVDLPGLPPPVAKTNAPPATAAQDRPTDPDDPDSKTADEETPSVDITLAEAERILVDLIALSANKPEIVEAVRYLP
jgi:hypothetical protein